MMVFCSFRLKIIFRIEISWSLKNSADFGEELKTFLYTFEIKRARVFWSWCHSFDFFSLKILGEYCTNSEVSKVVLHTYSTAEYSFSISIFGTYCSSVSLGIYVICTDSIERANRCVRLGKNAFAIVTPSFIHSFIHANAHFHPSISFFFHCCLVFGISVCHNRIHITFEKNFGSFDLHQAWTNIEGYFFLTTSLRNVSLLPRLIAFLFRIHM